MRGAWDFKSIPTHRIFIFEYIFLSKSHFDLLLNLHRYPRKCLRTHALGCDSSDYIFSPVAGSECRCHDWHGCIMAQSIVGLENVQPYKFSECSNADYISALKDGKDVCLLNKPNEVTVYFMYRNKG